MIPEFHPVQVQRRPHTTPVVPKAVALKAYEVYSHCFTKQDAMINGGCRGGFGAGEYIAFLYAASLPKAEWRARVDEALAGMVSP